MTTTPTEHIRNILLAGTGGRGKTTLAEALLFLTGGSDRLGRVPEGTTVMDFDPEEKKRLHSISLSIAAAIHQDKKLNLLDSPGMLDFAAGFWEGLRAAETVLVVEGAGHRLGVGSELAVQAAVQAGHAVAFAVTRCDLDDHDFYKTLESLQGCYGNKICPIIVPTMTGAHVTGYADLLRRTAFTYQNGKPSPCAFPEDDRIESLRALCQEAAAASDDLLTEKFLSGEDLSVEELETGLMEGVCDGTLYPVFACSGLRTDGVELLLHHLAAATPAPAPPENSSALAAICFKTVADPFVGKLSYIKVQSGTITHDTPAYNPETGETERMGKLLSPHGAHPKDSAVLTAGDIGIIAKLSHFHTGSTLSDAKHPVILAGLTFPEPSLSLAAHAAKKGDDDKAAAGMSRLLEEDPTLRFALNPETHEQILSGLGDQHLDVVRTKLSAKFGAELTLTAPRIAYRETIRKKVEAQGKHKKQSGGHGQFGDVHIRFEPITGEAFLFAEEVVGGAVPRQYFPAVEKGLHESLGQGYLAGYPMVGVKATLFFGSYHPVDSSELAFKTAAHVCFRAAMAHADPVLLEPLGKLHVSVPEDHLGDLMSDITHRRGHVLGMGAAEASLVSWATQELEAEVPLAEMSEFTTALRQMTAGRGQFTLVFSRYAEVPAAIQEKIIKAAAVSHEST